MEKRGGGAVVFNDIVLARALRQMVFPLTKEQTGAKAAEDDGSIGGPDLVDPGAPRAKGPVRGAPPPSGRSRPLAANATTLPRVLPTPKRSSSRRTLR
jgi:hypothetical protein